VRTPPDVPSRVAKPRSGHLRWWIVGGVLVLIVLLGSLRSLAGLYTDSLWFSNVGFHRVWSTILAVKVGLFASFGAAFFVVLWVNLVICDRIAAHSLFADPADDFVRRYQRFVRPYAGRVYAVLALAIALIAAATTIGQWNSWLLFTHATSFAHKDPQFGLNDGFFVFRLPFLQFLVDWTLASLVVVLVLTALFHYLNGGIRPRGTPHVSPAVKVHLSVLLALVALTKAAGYVLSRFSLDLSTNGYVEGAGYADAHARLPALDVLFFVSLFAAAILLFNIWRQGWTLPVLAVGVWAFVALVIGVIYPAVLQALKVNPAQSTLERAYIARNIKATRYAYGLDHVKVSSFPDNTVVPDTIDSDLTTLDNIRLWDPSATVSLADFQNKQAISDYYTFQTVQVDRYTAGGTIRPAIVGVRQIDPASLPSSSWVNLHLQYTHGEGLVLAEANEATAKGNPVFAISDVPSKSASGFPNVTQPAIYFGVNQPGYVIADTHQPELDGLRPTGGEVEGHYEGSGGVQLGSFLTRAAFALRLGDLNLLLSNLVTSQSRIMFIRDVRTMAEKAAPFLSYDSQPYPALVDGHVDWILNAYTTTANYPYSQNANTQNLPTVSGLPSTYNYVRNSVVVVVNAYTGKMRFYAMDPNDPILQAYESAFPKMFEPKALMPTSIKDQLRYGNDLFAAQAAIYGRYHITSPAQFYAAGDAWIVSPTTGVSSPTQRLRQNFVLNQQGQIISGTYQPMTPVYQVEAEPGHANQSFTVTDAYVPAGRTGTKDEFLRALLVGNSNPSQFGQLHVYETPPGKSKVGPILADSEIKQTTTVSRQITLLNTNGSHVRLGNILPVLVGRSVLYVRPLYVVSTTVGQPQLKYVVAVLGQNVKMERTLGATLNALLHTKLKSTGGVLTTTPNPPTVTPPSSSSGKSSSSSVAKARTLLARAASDFSKAQADLKAGNLGGYQSEVAAAQAATAKADEYLSGGSSSSSSAHPKASDMKPPPTTALSASTNAGVSRSGLFSPSSTSGGEGTSSASTTSGAGTTTTTTQPNET
jgi:uncharacterized protein